MLSQYPDECEILCSLPSPPSTCAGILIYISFVVLSLDKRVSREGLQETGPDATSNTGCWILEQGFNAELHCYNCDCMIGQCLY